LVRLLGLSATLHQLTTFRIGNAGLSLAKPAPATAIFHRLASFRIGNGGAILVRLLGLSATLHLFATFRIGDGYTGPGGLPSQTPVREIRRRLRRVGTACPKACTRARRIRDAPGCWGCPNQGWRRDEGACNVCALGCCGYRCQGVMPQRAYQTSRLDEGAYNACCPEPRRSGKNFRPRKAFTLPHSAA
jgi:hypothetical protein